jgi:hypothetical protein
MKTLPIQANMIYVKYEYIFEKMYCLYISILIVVLIILVFSIKIIVKKVSKKIKLGNLTIYANSKRTYNNSKSTNDGWYFLVIFELLTGFISTIMKSYIIVFLLYFLTFYMFVILDISD